MNDNKYIRKFKEGSKTFSFAANFLPSEYKEDVAHLYTICRTPDDIADSDELSILEKTTFLEDCLKDEEIKAFLDSHEIPFSLYESLISGLKQDLYFEQPQTFDDLYDYCYKVAGTVGIMLCHLFDVKDENAHEYAEKLGVAMQITNILRDVKEDTILGRIYFPVEDLQRFNVSGTNILNNEFNENFKNLIMHYADISRAYYVEASDGISYLPKGKVQYSIRVASKTYSLILNKLERRDYNPFIGRVYVPYKEKVLNLLPSLVFKA